MRKDIECLAGDMGWNDETLLELIMQWANDKSGKTLLVYLQEIAVDEEAYKNDDMDEDG